jgi:hypothetical protein
MRVSIATCCVFLAVTAAASAKATVHVVRPVVHAGQSATVVVQGRGDGAMRVGLVLASQDRQVPARMSLVRSPTVVPPAIFALHGRVVVGLATAGLRPGGYDLVLELRDPRNGRWSAFVPSMSRPGLAMLTVVR